ncbi:RNA polymerase subunit sigma [Streptomyces sp. NPDC059582]|uniref:RNA polymerase subunit sigma n=1 Tax=Streptomyces sp. NPDC059582 TaxID=3346875 RepID=UPI0036CA8E89
MDQVGDAVPLAELLDERRHLLEVARWMLGDRIAAERVINEAYRRWYGLSDPERARVVAPRAWLTHTVGGICLARLALPYGDGHEGAQSPALGTPDRGARLEREVRAVLLRTLDSLSPAERAAFVLNDVFGMAPRAAAGIVGEPEPECAELAERARQSLRDCRAEPTSPCRQDEIAHAVRRACADEDAGLLTSLLAPDATASFDGGGRIRALTRPVHGSEQIARSLLTLLARHPRTTLHTHSVNGRTGLVARYDDQVAAVITLDIAGSRVVQVWVILNPDKLRAWNRPFP